MLVFYTLSFLTRRSNRRLPFWLRNVSVETHGRLAADPAQRSHRSGRYPQTRRIRDRSRVDKCGHARSEESPYSSPKLCAIEEIRQLKSRYFEATATTTRSMSAWAGRGSSPRSLRLGFALSGPTNRHVASALAHRVTCESMPSTRRGGDRNDEEHPHQRGTARRRSSAQSPGWTACPTLRAIQRGAICSQRRSQLCARRRVHGRRWVDHTLDGLLDAAWAKTSAHCVAASNICVEPTSPPWGWCWLAVLPWSPEPPVLGCVSQ